MIDFMMKTNFVNVISRTSVRLHTVKNYLNTALLHFRLFLGPPTFSPLYDCCELATPCNLKASPEFLLTDKLSARPIGGKVMLFRDVLMAAMATAAAGPYEYG